MKCSILWAQFPLRDSADLVNMARRHSVRVAAGSIRTCDKDPRPVRPHRCRPAPGIVHDAPEDCSGHEHGERTPADVVDTDAENTGGSCTVVELRLGTELTAVAVPDLDADR